VVVERFRLICALAPSTNGPWTVLDAGCGSGRYALALARAGASRVLGVDAAAAKIDLAGKEAAAAGVSDRCTFVTSPFLDLPIDEKFDVVVATGYFDYLENPVEHLQKMVAACRGRIFITIPKRWEFRVPIRMIRFRLERGFVRFYSKRELGHLLRRAGIAPSQSAVIDLGRDWVVVIKV
jgi:SAM-dependent methyltransferase